MTTVIEDALEARFGVAFESGGDLPDAPTLATILRRCTHLSYTDQPIPEEVVKLVLATALSASAKSDYQQASIIRVKDAEKRQQLAALVPAMPWIGRAPAFFVFCGDAHRLERICEMRGHPHPNENLESFFNASVDAALVMQTFILAAEAVGLGCCPISVIRNHMPAVTEILRLPKRVFPVAGLCLGYPAAEGHISMRLPPTVTVHTDAYDDAELPAEIHAYDRRRNARHATPREQQRAPKVFGFADFYGWSEDKARQAARPEGTQFGRHIRDHGFTLA